MMGLTFGQFTQVSDSGPHSPLFIIIFFIFFVFVCFLCKIVFENALRFYLHNKE